MRVSRRARELAAILLVAGAAATQLPLAGWNAGAHLALVQSLVDGTPRIDHHLNQSGDIAWVDGHYYAAKSPGLAFFSVPVYLAFDAAGALPLVAAEPNQQGAPGAKQVHPRSIWQVNLTVVAAFLVLLLLARGVADALAPGSGAAVALMLGLGTLLLPFASSYFSHVLSATLGFAAFALARAGRNPTDRALVLAGALAGLAVFAEIPLVLVAAAVGLYVAVDGPRVRRVALYAAGFVLGVLPLAAYNAWAFGSPFKSGYANAVKTLGASGHDAIGANGSGFFGLGRPSLRAAWDLVLSDKGLFTLSPVTLLALLGLPLLARRGFVREAILVGGLAVAFLVYNAAYYLPFGGASPGPRFLVPLLPFLALPLAPVFGRRPTVTVVVAAVSAFWMVAATAAGPLIPLDVGPTSWLGQIRDGTEYPGSIFARGTGGLLWLVVPALLGVGLVLRPPAWLMRIVRA